MSVEERKHLLPHGMPLSRQVSRRADACARLVYASQVDRDRDSSRPVEDLWSSEQVCAVRLVGRARSFILAA